MQLTSFTDYGLRSLMYLAAHPDKLCSVREIAEYYGISRNHLVKVVHRLSQLGYIESSKGKGGGIKLDHDPSAMKIGDLVRALEPSMALVECFDPASNTCNITKACQLKHFLSEANSMFIATLNRHTLADTVSDRKVFLNVS